MHAAYVSIRAAYVQHTCASAWRPFLVAHTCSSVHEVYVQREQHPSAYLRECLEALLSLTKHHRFVFELLRLRQPHVDPHLHTQHTLASVSIRQHPSAYAEFQRLRLAYVSIGSIKALLMLY